MLQFKIWKLLVPSPSTPPPSHTVFTVPLCLAVVLLPLQPTAPGDVILISFFIQRDKESLYNTDDMSTSECEKSVI